MLCRTLLVILLIPSLAFAQMESHFDKARKYYDQDQFREALYHLKKALATDSTNAPAFKMRGNCYLEINQVDSALRDYERAIRLDPKLTEVNYNISLIYAQKDSVKLQEQFLRRFLLDRPNDTDGLIHLASLVRRTSPDSGQYFINKAYQLNPNDVVTNDALANELMRQGKHREAYDFCVRARKTFRHHFELIETQAYAAFAIGSFGESASLADSLNTMEAGVRYQALAAKSRILQNTKKDLFTQTGFKFRFNAISSDETATLDKWVNDPGHPYHYPVLLDRFHKKEALGLDEYFMLYYGFTTDQRYSPYFSPQHGMAKSMKDDAFEEVVNEAQKLLQTDEFNPDLVEYLFVGQLHRGKGDHTQALTLYLGLMEGILATGSGESMNEAWIVTSPSHEYSILSFLGKGSQMQSLLMNKGHHFDKLDSVDEDGKKQGLYFNIDKPFGSLSMTFKTDDRKGATKKKSKKKK
jgi:tetratricopeptide (TPR) repeat protein